VLKLSRSDDDAMELDGAAFGDLAHAVLENFGRGDVREATDATTIQQELNHLLNELVRNRFGSHPSAALVVQIEQLRLRLQALARWQADWVAQGWRIEHAEISFSDRPGRLDVDGESMLLTGRIDRIDVNTQTGQRMILDYKTSDAGDSPEKTHRRRSGEWIDLQLPLYRHLARELEIDGPVGLGYLLLPKSTADIGLSPAQWTDAELEDADATASDVVRMVRDQQFWPPADPPPAFSEEFAAICMDGVFGGKK
jgi:ATP-dependent helicase/DNAse subunit B